MGKISVSSFRDLIAWQKAMDLVTETYKATGKLAAEERYGLASQMRRSAVSIPSNIAEGWGRETKQEYMRFLHIARSSALELSTQCEICHRLNSAGEWMKLCRASEEVARILLGLVKSLQAKSQTRRPATNSPT